MPSTLVHLALAGLLAAGLLADAFGLRSLLVVFGLTALPDLDSFLALVIPNTHRAALHTLLLPLVLGALVLIDARREHGWLRSRYGATGVRTAGVAVLAMAVAGIGPDLFTSGANVFYPVYDQFLVIDGKVVLSNQRGLVQTFIEFGSEDPAAGTGVGSTNTTHYDSGVDPVAGSDPANVERIFPLVRSGWQLLLVVASTITLLGRFRDNG
ncbi:MAG: metal-dependent hydrolase [Halobacteriaceae archaeon]